MTKGTSRGFRAAHQGHHSQYAEQSDRESVHRAELEYIRDLCVRWNAFCITDEIYEHILYDGAEHISMARIEGMRERTS